MEQKILEQKAKIFDLINEKEFHQTRILELQKAIDTELQNLSALIAKNNSLQKTQ